MALSKTERNILPSATNAAGGVTRGVLDLETAHCGILTIKITNGATGPTVQCVCNVLIAHKATLPAAGSAGADWKTIRSYGGGTTANGVTEVALPIDIAVMALCVEFKGNTVQPVTVEAHMSEISTI